MSKFNMVDFIENYALISLRVSTWSGRRNNSASDLGIEDEISKEFASLGGKNVFDKEKLKFQGVAKREAETKLDMLGFRCLGGWAIKKEVVGQARDEIEKIRDAYHVERNALIATYDEECNNWIRTVEQRVSIPDLVDSVRRSLYPKEYINQQMGFSYEINDDLMNNPIGDAASNTIADMAADSLRAFTYTMETRKGFSRRCLSYLSKLKDKLADLAFVDSFAEPALRTIESFEAEWPKGGGQISKEKINELCSLLSLLSNPSYLTSLRNTNLEVIDDAVDDAEEEQEATNSLFADEEFERALALMFP